MDPQQQQAFEQALQRKHEDAERKAAEGDRAALEGSDVGGDQASLREAGRTQDTFSVRDKNTGHGKKTADKWNQ